MDFEKNSDLQLFWGEKSSSSNLVFQTEKLQKSSGDKLEECLIQKDFGSLWHEIL